jgi:hypothetical protein
VYLRQYRNRRNSTGDRPPTPIPENSSFTVVVEAASAGPSLGANHGRELALPLVERDIGGAMASPRPG